MRVELTYRVKQLSLLDYRMQVFSLIKESIRMSDYEYYERLFIYKKNEMQDFSFSVYFVHFVPLEDNQIKLDKMIITISSASLETFTHIFNGIRKLTVYKVGNQDWEQTNLQLHHTPTIKKHKVLLSCKSPVLIENQQHKSLAPSDSTYNKEFNYYANLQLRNITGRDLLQPLRFTPIQMKKVVVKFRHRHLENHKFLFLTAYSGLFQLEGHPDDLNVLYNAGFGKRSAYFGLTQLVEEVE